MEVHVSELAPLVNRVRANARQTELQRGGKVPIRHLLPDTEEIGITYHKLDQGPGLAMRPKLGL